MLFRDVAPNQAWRPESAARYNAVNLLLRSEDLPAQKLQDPGGCTAGFINDSDQDIAAYSAVAITGCAFADDPAWQYGRLSGNAVFSGYPAVDDSLPWAVALQDIAPGMSGQVVLSGIAPANFTGQGKFVTPSAAGLTAGENGNALILAPPENGLPGLVVMGGASGGQVQVSNEYTGFFKLQTLSAVSVMICNGFNPAASYCGTTDVPGIYNVSRTILEFPEMQKVNIFLVFFYDQDSRKYSAEFMSYLPENMVFYRLIGTFDCGKTVQAYKNDNSQMIFGDKWYLV